jgi:hypothetical protein
MTSVVALNRIPIHYHRLFAFGFATSQRLQTFSRGLLLTLSSRKSLSDSLTVVSHNDRLTFSLRSRPLRDAPHYGAGADFDCVRHLAGQEASSPNPAADPPLSTDSFRWMPLPDSQTHPRSQQDLSQVPPDLKPACRNCVLQFELPPKLFLSRKFFGGH